MRERLTNHWSIFINSHLLRSTNKTHYMIVSSSSNGYHDDGIGGRLGLERDGYQLNRYLYLLNHNLIKSGKLDFLIFY